MAEGQLPQQLQDQIQQFNNLQQQLQVLAQQKYQFEAQAKEAERANKALAAASDDSAIYKSVGAFLIQTPGKNAVLRDMEEEAETVGVRIKNLDRQESRLKESLNELQSKIENALARMREQGSATDES